jgi:signal transduction histidine kinase
MKKGMNDLRHPWETRFDRMLIALQWLTLALGVFGSFVQFGAVPRSLAATITAGAYVLGSQILPRRLLARGWLIELVAVGGVALTMLAVALSQGIQSPFLLLSLMPTLFASVSRGLRVGLETAVLALGALAAISAVDPAGFDPRQVVLWGALYVLIAATFSYARRLLIEEGARARALEAASEETRLRLRRLEHAHGLLTRLVDLADAAELNPVSVGRAALENLASMVPYDAGMVALAGDQGPVVVAKRGGLNGQAHRTFIPLQVAGREVGLMVLARDAPFDLTEQQIIEESLRPVSLAFDNILLLQDIARRAIREERARLARDLHDEIGPSLASLGLALDLALLQHPTEPALAAHLDSLRRSLSTLVEEVRTTVADLRQPDQTSILEHARGLARLAGPDGPQVVIVLEERRPPRASMAPQITAIMSEAFRNALRHAEAGMIRIEGFIDEDRGRLVVRDDGRGFDPEGVPEGRFGLTGMKERAQSIGATLQVGSRPGAGASVNVEWKE